MALTYTHTEDGVFVEDDTVYDAETAWTGDTVDASGYRTCVFKWTTVSGGTTGHTFKIQGSINGNDWIDIRVLAGNSATAADVQGVSHMLAELQTYGIDIPHRYIRIARRTAATVAGTGTVSLFMQR